MEITNCKAKKTGKCLLEFTAIFVFFLINLQTFAQSSNAVLSSRWYHPKNGSDSYSTEKAIVTVHPDRIDWTYCDNPAQLKVYQKHNVKYSLAINPQIPDSGEYSSIKFRIVDVSGKPYIPSWMKSWKSKNLYWGCVNNPMFKKLFFDKTIQYSQLGAYGIFVDDALFNVQLQKEKKNLYGCFCKFCVKGFKQYQKNAGLKSDIDFSKIASDLEIEEVSDEDLKLLKLYQKYQELSVVNFLKNWKAAVLKINPKLKFIANNYKGSWNDVYRIFDSGIAEISLSDLNVKHLDSLFNAADKFHKNQIFSLASNNADAQNFLIAYCILRKRDYLIPWDIFSPSKENSTQRYYGDLTEINKLITDLKSNKIQVEISSKPFTFSAETIYYRFENRSNYKAMVLNSQPFKLGSTWSLKRKLVEYWPVVVIIVTFLIALYFITKRKSHANVNS